MLKVPERRAARYHDRGQGPQPLDDLSGFVEQTHVGVAGGEKAMRLRVGRILLDRGEELGHRLIEAPAGEMRSTDC